MPRKIAMAAGVHDLQPCNWAYGIEKAYFEGRQDLRPGLGLLGTR